MKIQLPQETIQKILDYLITKPFCEVFNLINEIQSKHVVINDEKPD